MQTITTILLTILVLANLFMMAVVAVTLKDEGNEADKIGFTFMELVFACNVIAIVGGYAL